jgi:hypothetical protein
MSESDSFWLNFWEVFASIGIIAVIIGIIGEGSELLVKWIREKRFKKFKHGADDKLRCIIAVLAKYVRPRILEVETFAFALVIVGLMAEFWGGHKSKIILDRNNTDLSMRVETLRKANDELEAKIPRSLKPFDRIILERVLSGYPDKPKVTIFLAVDASDAQEIGQQLFDCFSHAHFPMNPDMPVGVVSDGGGHGIIVGEYGVTNKTADAIVFDLKQFGLAAKTNGGLSSSPNEIFIRIEKK